MLSRHRNSYLRITSAAKGGIAIIAFFISLQISYSQYSETLYDMEDGLNHNTVLDISCDENGFIWVFTASGLNRFDGHRFKEYKVDLNGRQMSIPFNTKLMNDSRNRLWIHGLLQNLLMYNNELDRIQVVHEAKYHDYYGLVDDERGNIFLTSFARDLASPILLLKEDPDYTFTAEEFSVPEEVRQIKFIHRLPDGTMLCSGTKGLFTMKMHEESPQFKRIELLMAADSSVYEVEGPLKFICDYNSLYLHSRDKILLTNITGSDSFGDSVIFVKPLELNFPDIGLHPGQPLFSVISDKKGALFVRSINGIYHFNPEKRSAELIRAESYGETDQGSWDVRRVLYYDNNGILWAGTDQGLLKIVFGNKAFQTISPQSDHPRGLKSGKVKSVVQDFRGHLWVGTYSDGLFHSVPDTTGRYRTFSSYLANPEDPLSIHSNFVTALFEDSQHRLWVGTESIQWMDLEGEKGAFHYPEAPKWSKVLGYGVFPVEILEDPEGNILVLSYQGPKYLIRPDGYESFPLTEDSAALHPIAWRPSIQYTSDKDGYMFYNSIFYGIPSGWVLKQSGDPEWPGYAYPRQLDTLWNLDSLYAIWAKMCIYEHKGQKELWLNIDKLDNLYRAPIESLRKGATYHPEAVFETGIKGIHDLFQDKSGFIWCSTKDGLVRIDPGTEDISYYFDEDGLPTNEFTNGYELAEDGTIFLCTHRGLVYFHPDSIRNDPPPEVHISGLRYNYKPVQADDQGILVQSILQTDRLELAPDQNFLGFEFSVFDYRNTERIRYKYRLEGVDEDWVRSDERHTVDYPDLKPGSYTFRVIAANGNGVWNMEGAALEIHILHPLWFRWWAIMLEVLLVISLLIAWIRFREKNLKQRALELELKVEDKTRQILEQRKEVDEMKSRFYTNISHEFRTPLSLLIAPLEDSLKRDQDDEGISLKVRSIMLRNARRLQRLISQLLDISKLESGKIELQVQRGELSNFIRTVASSFLSLAESRDLKFKMNIEQQEKVSYFDSDKVEKVTINLLSNAFKFCGADGIVSLGLEYRMSDDGENSVLAIVRVEDTGKGMEEEHLERIFDRFYQVSDKDTREAEGSGIGLALTKELVELMHGKIEVESEPGKGSLFTVILPVSREYFIEHGYEVSEKEESVNGPLGLLDTANENDGLCEEKELDKQNAEELILVVEDNPDLREYIVGQFRGQYRVIEAENGEEGFDKSIEYIPDLVITDLMMPVMGGMEFCRKLKEHPAVNHIPVIMLTAKADKESRLEGLEAAADDYIIKPFDSELLFARARNLIKQRKELRNHFKKELILSPHDKIASTPQYRMLRDIVQLIEEHVDDPEFDLSIMSSNLNMSLSGMYRKINAITGSTPHELVRMIRMKRAAAMLRKGELNVTQVMYNVGMKNPSHFARSFRQYFGVNPGEYRNNSSTL